MISFMQKIATISEYLRAAQIADPEFFEHILSSDNNIFCHVAYESDFGIISKCRIFDTPLFDEAHYLQQIDMLAIEAPRDEETLIHHWLRVGVQARIVPTPWFDEAFYLEHHGDVSSAGLFGYLHFVQHGQAEERRPNRWCDPVWYRQQCPELDRDVHPLIHILTSDSDRDIAPSRALRLFDWKLPDRAVRLARLHRLDRLMRSLGASMTSEQLEQLLLTFVAPAYCDNVGLPAETDALEALAHFAATGLMAGISAHPLFEPGVYAAAAAAADLPARAIDEPALLHWIRYGRAARIVPNPYFDEAFYLARYPEVQEAGYFGFEHFLLHGAFEERRPNAWFEPGFYQTHPAAQASRLPGFYHYLLQGRALGLAPSQGLVRVRLTVRELAQLTELQPVIQKAVERLRLSLEQDLIDILIEMFVSDHTIRVSRLDGRTLPVEALAHFLQTGLWADVSPSPLFDVAWYRARVAEQKDIPPIGDMPAIVHFLEHGRWRRIMPTPRLSNAFYQAMYPEFDPNWLISFDHFSRYGVREGRRPTPWFDMHWALSHLERKPELPVYLHLLVHEIDDGFTPCRGLAMVLGAARSRQLNLAVFDALLVASEPWVAGGELHDLDLALALFMPEAYSGGGDLAADATAMERLLHFLRIGLRRGDPIGPLFDAACYADRARAAGLPPIEGAAFCHFLRHGAPARIVPTPLFDDALYRSRNADLGGDGMWTFRHYLLHGLYEGRTALRGASLPAAFLPGPVGAPMARRHFIVAAGGSPVDGNPAQQQHFRWIGRMRDRLADALGSEQIAEAVRQAAVLDPVVGELTPLPGVLVPPFYDILAGAHDIVRDRLQRLDYDTVICVPWIRTGGADRLAGEFASSLRRIRPDETILLLRTDNPHFERPDFISEDIETLDMSDVVKALDSANAERLLYTLLAGLKPQRVVNINSFLCWKTFQRFGRQLAGQMRLYAYLLCWDQSPTGVRTGYPSEFYPVTAHALTGLFTDSIYLKRELTEMYALPRHLQDRLITLYTPCRVPPSKLTMAEQGAASVGRRERPLILWGGRLDYQKRFDILEAVAWKMPHVDFRAWGRSTFGPGPDLGKLPSNITMMGEYRSMLDLPLGECDGWLFTSAYEGTPITVIELASLGVPMVASAVSGVPEIINATTGWPIEPEAGVGAYVAALDEMISRPGERTARAARAQALVTARYCFDTYDRAVDAVLQAEVA